MLNILIVDDEAPARSRLRRMVGEIPDCSVVGEAASGQEALEQIGKMGPDALLLDISMPGLDGMSLARAIKKRDPAPAVIFCTAYADQALEAFECDAVDYLVKPVRRERLAEAFEKARRILGQEGEATPDAYVLSTVGGRKRLIDISEVACFRAEDKYTTVFHGEEETLINDSLVELEEQFTEYFVRVHRNALVARDRVRGLERRKGGGMLVLLEGCPYKPQVSRRRLPAVRRLIKDLH